ncbi:hypothetical protein D3C81_2280540 [compost metagenome]
MDCAFIVITDRGKTVSIPCQQHQGVLPGGDHRFGNTGKTEQHHAGNVAASEHTQVFFHQLG